MIYRIWHWAFNPEHDKECKSQYEPMPFEVKAIDERGALLNAWCGMGSKGEVLYHSPKDHFNTFEYFKRSISKIEQLDN